MLDLLTVGPKFTQPMSYAANNAHLTRCPWDTWMDRQT